MKLSSMVALALFLMFALACPANGGERVKLDPGMVTSEAAHGTPGGMVDEQAQTAGNPPSGKPATPWEIPSQHWKTIFPVSAHIDLGQERFLSTLFIYDTNNTGELIISAGRPGEWAEVLTYDCKAYLNWVELPLDVKTRYLRFTRKDGGSNFTEIALFEQTEQQHAAAVAKKAAEAKERAEREAAQAKAKIERDAAVAKAMQEVKNRLVIDLGEPFGRLTLVDEIDVAAGQPDHMFTEVPAGASRVESILGKPVRVLNKTPGEAAYMSFRIGK